MNSLGKFLLLVVLALLGGAVLVGGCVYSGYNRTIRLDENVASSWAQVENQLQRRFDLIPNLVETVRGYAAHEEGVFTQLAKSREAYFQAKEQESVPGMARAASGFEAALSRLLVLRETYPELKANESFQKLMDSIEGTENRLAVERKRYNDAVRDLNQYVRSLLGRFYASLAGVDQAEYFNPPEETAAAPKVDFTGTAPQPTPGGA